ncbi:MAG: S24 family peptidase, partial [Clostridiaceae bacterium]|nr:S24 family peptidase [Clostridiaceae bacterium]
SEPEVITVESAALKVIPKVADFAVMVRGGAMEPLIKDGSVVFAKDQSNAEDGDIALAEVDGKLTCRKYHMKGRRVELHPENPLFEPITKYQSIKILGKVII